MKGKAMVFPMVFLKLADWLLGKSGYRADRKIKTFELSKKNPSFISSPQQPHLFPCVSKCDLRGRESQTLVCDIDGALLRQQSFFPYFMLVAFEGGSILRAFLLLLSSPLLWVLDYDLGLRLMIFITFCGLRVKSMESVGRAVLPKFYLENLHLQAYEVMASVGSRVVLTSAPRVLVEGFLKEYLGVGDVVGTELHTVGNFFSGLLSKSGMLVKHKALKEFYAENKPDIGLGSSSQPLDHAFLSLCKEGYVVNKEDPRSSQTLPRNKYPKPLIFHDGRLAFLPTPQATFLMFLYLPLGLILAIFRLLIGTLLPYKIAIFLASCSGVTISLKASTSSPKNSQKSGRNGVLYVCTHRTLLDPVFLSTALAQPLTAVTYSLSKMSELISPIRTVRLTRDRAIDGETMKRLLSEGDLVVCPEGTTCREPYLLRFSPLFAELADEILPVAIKAEVGMFYGTTASGSKWLDPIFFLMNPRPKYHIQILEKVPKELTCAGGKSSFEVANLIQRQLGDALGFECTALTRRDKYMMLAGNEGLVQDKRKSP